jgi:hypothetical protein
MKGRSTATGETSGLQGMEQAGDTIAPEIVLEPSLSAALRLAEAPWGASEQQVTLSSMHCCHGLRMSYMPCNFECQSILAVIIRCD